MNWVAKMHAEYPSHATTVVTLESVGDVTVTTVEFDTAGYECNGFESVTTLPNGQQWGCGPDNGETPAELHALVSEPAALARAVAEMRA